MGARTCFARIILAGGKGDYQTFENGGIENNYCLNPVSVMDTQYGKIGRYIH